jgi:hypothetical protein
MRRWLAVTGLYVACAATGGFVVGGDAVGGAVFGLLLAPFAAIGTLEMASKGRDLPRAILTTLAIVIVPAVIGALVGGAAGLSVGALLGALLAAGSGVAQSKTPPPYWWP